MDQAKNWQHLPNADHIDWVLESLKENHTLWAEARSGRDFTAEILRSFDAPPEAQRADAAALDAAWVAARDVSGSTWTAAWDAARDAAWHSLSALVAYDDCDQYLAMGYEKLKVYAILSEKPQAVLLLPMAYVLEKINEKALV